MKFLILLASVVLTFTSSSVFAQSGGSLPLEKKIENYYSKLLKPFVSLKANVGDNIVECSAYLISPTILLTATHCLDVPVNAISFEAGTSPMGKPFAKISLDDVFFQRDDLAMVHLKTPVKHVTKKDFSNIILEELSFGSEVTLVGKANFSGFPNIVSCSYESKKANLEVFKPCLAQKGMSGGPVVGPAPLGKISVRGVVSFLLEKSKIPTMFSSHVLDLPIQVRDFLIQEGVNFDRERDQRIN